MTAGDAGGIAWGRASSGDTSPPGVLDALTPPPSARMRLPARLRRARQVVAVTVHLPEFLLATAGLLQRLAAAKIQVDVLVAGAATPGADRSAAIALSRLEVPGVRRHRLALPLPIGPDRADDLLAGLSELVGFDPEPGVFCMAPAVGGGSGEALAEAAERICEVYQLPLLRYPATPGGSATDLELDTAEWTRKCAALDACATQVTPLSGRLEHFGVG